MLTSRLKQAAASAQLFVQRCLLNLEVDILAKTDLDPKWKQWKWMKQYRVWEANRKVFLYPENWIEPELRDEKSPFFKDLESELMQNDVTNETAEQAYLNYLEKLDKVANLEIRAMYNQIISQDESVLHVFGRSRSSQAPEHYYRKRINGGALDGVGEGRTRHQRATIWSPACTTAGCTCSGRSSSTKARSADEHDHAERQFRVRRSRSRRSTGRSGCSGASSRRGSGRPRCCPTPSTCCSRPTSGGEQRERRRSGRSSGPTSRCGCIAPTTRRRNAPQCRRWHSTRSASRSTDA